MSKIQSENEGFSLIELIIVVAVLAVLIGIIAPQYLKYVEKSKRVTDVHNAQEIRDAVERVITISDDDLVYFGHCRFNAKYNQMPSGEPTNMLEAMFLEMGKVPVSVVNKDYYWGIECENRADADKVRGTVTRIYLIKDMSSTKMYELWPDPSEFLEKGLE